MTISIDIFNALQSLVGGRCYPDTFDQPDGGLPAWPSIRYQRIGGDVHADICGTGNGDGDTTLIQIDVVASTHAARETLIAQVRAAMEAFGTPTTLDGSPRNEYDAETKTYRSSMDYHIHS